MTREELYHHGVKGQKWGVRRFQNKDGSLTTKGRNRYNGMSYKKAEKIVASGNAKKIKKYQRKLTNEQLARALKRLELTRKVSESEMADYREKAEKKMSKLNQTKKVAEIVAATAGATSAIAVAFTKVSQLSGNSKVFLKVTPPNAK